MTPELLIGSITLFVLSIFLGFELITKVPATLHTPLMSGANAISGISIVGALIGANVAYEGGDTAVSGILAFIAVVLAAGYFAAKDPSIAAITGQWAMIFFSGFSLLAIIVILLLPSLLEYQIS